jgi:molecular chaperone GrpE
MRILKGQEMNMTNDDTDSKTKWQKIADEDKENDIEQEEGDEGAEGGESGGENSSAEQTQPAGLEHPNYKALEDKLTDAEIKAHENWDKAVRAVAELENVRRRSQRDVENAHRYGIEKFASELLPVVDSLEQALQEKSDKNSSPENILHGIELTLKLLIDVLKKFSVEQLDPLGEAFDPNFHEAMSAQVNSEVKPNTVVTVFQKGYKLHDRVLRPARVVVSKDK